MHLKKIVLQNFRCFEQFELELHPRLNMLVGNNGTGKTTILEALVAGLTPVVRGLSTATLRLSTKGLGLKDTDLRLIKTAAGSWTTADVCQVVLESTSGIKWDVWRSAARGKMPSVKIGEAQLMAHLTAVQAELEHNAEVQIPVFAYYGASRGLVVPEKLHETKINYGFPTSALHGALNATNDFKEILKWFDAEETACLRESRAKGVLVESRALAAVKRAIIALLGGAFINPHINRERKFIVESEDGAPYQVSQLSQGYQSMLALAMDFARRLALASPSGDALAHPAVMMVDEIDVHLHPSWQQHAIPNLAQVFPNTQIIATTHSPQVLSTVLAESIHMLDAPNQSMPRNPILETRGMPSGDVLVNVMNTDPLPDLPEARATQLQRA